MARSHCSINAFLLAIIAALSIGLVTACENTARGLKEDVAEAERNTRDDRVAAREAASEVAQDAAHAARVLGTLAADAGEQVVERAGVAKDHAAVKAALMADAVVDASRLDVDVDAVARTVTISGTVRTNDERVRAEEIARAKAQGYTLLNKIAVR